MLVDILEKIKEETREKIGKIRRETNFEIEEMKKKGEKEIEQKKSKILEKARERVEKFLRKTESEIEQETKNLLLQKKRRALDAVFSQVLEKLKSLDKKSYQDLLLVLTEKIPDLKEGNVLVAAQREKETREFFEKQGIPVKGIFDSSGGFKFLCENFEIENTVENLIPALRSETEMKVINNLFLE